MQPNLSGTTEEWRGCGHAALGRSLWENLPRPTRSTTQERSSIQLAIQIAHLKAACHLQYFSHPQLSAGVLHTSYESNPQTKRFGFNVAEQRSGRGRHTSVAYIKRSSMRWHHHRRCTSHRIYPRLPQPVFYHKIVPSHVATQGAHLFGVGCVARAFVQYTQCRRTTKPKTRSCDTWCGVAFDRLLAGASSGREPEPRSCRTHRDDTRAPPASRQNIQGSTTTAAPKANQDHIRLWFGTVRMLYEWWSSSWLWSGYKSGRQRGRGRVGTGTCQYPHRAPDVIHEDATIHTTDQTHLTSLYRNWRRLEARGRGRLVLITSCCTTGWFSLSDL